MLQAKEHAPTPFPFIIFTFGLVVESIKELAGASSCQFGLKSRGGLGPIYLVWSCITNLTCDELIVKIL
jgi:hypothetical protein